MSSLLKLRMIRVACLALALAWTTGAAAQGRETVRIPLGRSEVITAPNEVRTLAIAEPKIADAAVGSQRTVVVSGKSAGITTLVVYGEAGRYSIYDVEVYVPNADKQVVLHVRVAEVNETAKRQLGIDLQGGGNVPDGGFLSGGLFTAKVASPTIPLSLGPNTDGILSFSRPGDWFGQVAWKLLEEKGDVRVLANPTLVARSGEKASFLAGGEFPVPIASGGGAAAPGSSSAVTVTIEWKEFGVKVDFTPTVREDGSIDLKVAPEVSQLDFSNPLALNGFTVPTLISRKTSTTVHLQSGENLVIGGLKQTDRLKAIKRVPILGQIPLIGLLFSSTRIDKVDRELLVVVSPETISGGNSQMPKLPTDRPSGVK